MEVHIQDKRNVSRQKLGTLSRLLRFLFAKAEVEINEAGDMDTQSLIDSIDKARCEWINANMNFEQAYGDDVIDYYTYQIKACELKYEHLIRKAKEKGIKLKYCTMAISNPYAFKVRDY